jgi:hypothetical protein
MDVWFGREEGRSLKLKHRVVGLEALKGSLIRVLDGRGGVTGM